jgi:hypothetical protein
MVSLTRSLNCQSPNPEVMPLKAETQAKIIKAYFERLY